MSPYNARHGPEIDDLIDKILIITAWGYALCVTKDLSYKNHSIDNYREQHDPNRKRFEKRENFLIIKQNISEAKFRFRFD